MQSKMKRSHSTYKISLLRRFGFFPAAKLLELINHSRDRDLKYRNRIPNFGKPIRIAIAYRKIQVRPAPAHAIKENFLNLPN